MTQEQNQQIQSIISTNDTEGAKIDQIAKVRGWFRPGDDSVFYPVIQDYLTQKIDIDEASEKLFAHIDSKIAANKLDDVNFKDLWYSVIHSARRTGYQEKEVQTKIAKVVTAFKNHSIPDNEKYNYLYSSMTGFSMACREAYNDTPEPGSAVHVEINAWANLNYFYGLVAGTDVFRMRTTHSRLLSRNTTRMSLLHRRCVSACIEHCSNWRRISRPPTRSMETRQKAVCYGRAKQSSAKTDGLSGKSDSLRLETWRV
jgi:hypothetical protein